MVEIGNLSATHIAAILKVSRTWLFRLKKQFPSEAPKDFKDPEEWRVFAKAHRIKPAAAPETVRARQALDGTQPGELSPNVRYTIARANRTETLAKIAELELAVTQRKLLPKDEVIADFRRMAEIFKARLLQMVGEAPGQLCGLNEAQTHKVMYEKVCNVLNGICLDLDGERVDLKT